MKKEIYHRGPISCAIAVTEELEEYAAGIFHDRTGDLRPVHAISVVGYGIENGIKYWLVRNSWGHHWGENGFFRVVRGVNNLAIESHCVWAVPEDTWTNKVTHKTTKDEKEDPRNADQAKNGPYPESSGFMKQSNDGCRVAETKTENRGTDPRGWELFPSVEALPHNFDWRAIENYGKTYNLLSWNKN